MSTTSRAPDLDTTPREELAIEQLVQRLQQRFPSLPAERVKDTVDARYHQFDHSRIRDFVPIFVERNAREDLMLAAAG